jgi:hypothetical protein
MKRSQKPKHYYLQIPKKTPANAHPAGVSSLLHPSSPAVS